MKAFDYALASVCFFTAVFVLGMVVKLITIRGLDPSEDKKIVDLAIIACILAGISVVMVSLGSRG